MISDHCMILLTSSRKPAAHGAPSSTQTEHSRVWKVALRAYRWYGARASELRRGLHAVSPVPGVTESVRHMGLFVHLNSGRWIQCQWTPTASLACRRRTLSTRRRALLRRVSQRDDERSETVFEKCALRVAFPAGPHACGSRSLLRAAAYEMLDSSAWTDCSD